MLINTFYERIVRQLLDLAVRADELLTGANIPYQFIGGFGVYLHVREANEEGARTTAHVDIALHPADLETAQRLDGFNVLLGEGPPHPRRIVKLFPTEGLVAPVRIAGLRVAPVAVLMEQRLSRNRMKDMMYLRDMIDAGLITPEMENALPGVLRERYEFVKAHE